MDDQGKLKVYRGALKATPTTTATAVATSSATYAVAAVAVPATVLGGGMYEEKRTHGSLMLLVHLKNLFLIVTAFTVFKGHRAQCKIASGININMRTCTVH